MALLSISADSHVIEPGDCYVDHIDPRFRDRAPAAHTDERLGAVMVIDGGRTVPYGSISASGRPADKYDPLGYVGWDELHPGGWDPKARLSEQDIDGVSAEVLYPTIGMLLCNHDDADYKKAFPNSQRVIAEQTAHLDPDVRDDILWRNCAALYGLSTPEPSPVAGAAPVA